MKVIKTYESPDKEWIESIMFSKAFQVLMFRCNHVNGEGIIENDLYEICTSNEQIIKLRDFLNSLKLSERD